MQKNETRPLSYTICKSEVVYISPHNLDSSLWFIQLSISHDCTLHISKISRWQYTALSYSLPNFEPVCYSMSSSNYCFLTCIQVSQETDKVVWYSHLFKNFPQVISDSHSQRLLTIVNEAELDVFLEFPCFFYDLMNVGNLISGSYAISKPSTSGSSWFTYCWNLAWRILSITLLACEMSPTVW